MSGKKRKKKKNPETELFELDEEQLLDPDYYYWNVIRPEEEAAEARREKRKQHRAARKARQAAVPQKTPETILPATNPPGEAELVKLIEENIRATHHANGWRHLSELGQHLRQAYPALQWSGYGCKRLIDFLQKYPDLFRLKWSAPAHRGASHVWVKIAQKKETSPAT